MWASALLAAMSAVASSPPTSAGLTYQLYFQDDLRHTITAPPGWSADTQPLPHWPREFVLVPPGATRATAEARGAA